jgi:hypothetical protein
MSAAVFGLTTTAHDDMGIGQSLGRLTKLIDAVSPMMYPSHYAKGEYGLADPNRQPYKVVSWGLRDAKRRLGSTAKLRPYLQDFSLGFRYGPAEVRAELRAARRQGVESWILWNPLNRYTWSALGPFTEAEMTPLPGEEEPPKPAAPRPAPRAAPGPGPQDLPPLPDEKALQEAIDKEEIL